MNVLVLFMAIWMLSMTLGTNGNDDETYGWNCSASSAFASNRQAIMSEDFSNLVAEGLSRWSAFVPRVWQPAENHSNSSNNNRTILIPYKTSVDFYMTSFNLTSGVWSPTQYKSPAAGSAGWMYSASDSYEWNLPKYANFLTAIVNDTYIIFARPRILPLTLWSFHIPSKRWWQAHTTGTVLSDTHRYSLPMYYTCFDLFQMHEGLYLVSRIRDGVIVYAIVTNVGGNAMAFWDFKSAISLFSDEAGFDAIPCYQSFRAVTDETNGMIHALGWCGQYLRTARFKVDRQNPSAIPTPLYDALHMVPCQLPNGLGSDSLVVTTKDGWLYACLFLPNIHSFRLIRILGNDTTYPATITEEGGYDRFSELHYYSTMQFVSVNDDLYIGLRAVEGLALLPVRWRSLTNSSNITGLSSVAVANCTIPVPTMQDNNYNSPACYPTLRMTSINATGMVYATSRCTGSGALVVGLKVRSAATSIGQHQVSTSTESLAKTATQSHGASTASPTMSNHPSSTRTVHWSTGSKSLPIATTSRTPSHSARQLEDAAQSNTVTESASTTNTLLPTNATEALTSAPPPPPNPQPPVAAKVGGVTSVALTVLTSQSSADAIVTTSSASAMAASVASPTSGAQVARIGATLRVIECEFSNIDEAPSFLEHPMHPALGDGVLRHYAGAVLCSTAFFLVLPLMAVCVLRHSNKPLLPAGSDQTTTSTTTTTTDSSGSGADTTTSNSSDSSVSSRAEHPSCIPLQLAGIVLTVMVAYFGPSVGGAATTLLLHGGNGTERVMGAVGLLALAGLLVYVGYQLTGPRFAVKWSRRRNTMQGMVKVVFRNDSKKAGQGHHNHLEAFGAFYDAVREPQRPVQRLFYLEDIVVASLMAGVAGIRPSSGDSCGSLAIALLLLALGHAGYLLVVRPYSRKLDAIFTGLLALNNIVLGAMSVRATYTADHGDVTMKAIAYCVFLQSIVFFVQAVAQCLWYYYTNSRRVLCATGGESPAALNVAPTASESSSSDSDDEELSNNEEGGALSVPMLEQKQQKPSINTIEKQENPLSI